MEKLSESSIVEKDAPDSEEAIKKILNPLVLKWFNSRFKEFSLPQLFSVLEIHSRQNILVSAPTGATKTLTGFLSIINELVDSSERGLLEDKVYCIYISPLKALNYDIEVNLKEPLKQIEEIAKRKFGIRVSVRTGDTTASEKAMMLKHPPHILITTPESLAIMLASPKFSQYLTKVDWCIVDEVHAIAESKRGVHLSVCMEMLQNLSGHISRVGLSATVAPLRDVAKFLVGREGSSYRPCKIVNVQFIKELDLKVLCPVKNLIETSHGMMHHEMYNLMHNLIQSHKTTLIFTNTRAATERVVDYLKFTFPKFYYESNIGAHHGSLSKEHRHQIESALREGKLKAVVSSTSLELGMDIGYIDLVILLGSPKSVARALQRCGRSGHKLHDVTKGRIIVLDRDDLVECAVLLKNAVEKKIDEIHIPRNCLDILAQLIFGFAVKEKVQVDAVYDIVTKSYCYYDLPKKDFMDLIDYLSGKHVTLEDRYVYSKIWHDETTGTIGRKGRMARVLYMTNIGTISEESFITIKIGEQSIGKIDESFLEKLKRGDIFVLGGNSYEFLFAKGMVAQVKASTGRPPNIPRWYSDMLPLSFDLALTIQRFRRLVNDKFVAGEDKAKIVAFINSYLYVDNFGANAIYEYLKEQYLFAQIPNDQKLIIESYDNGERRYCIFHSLFGRRVNDCLSRAIALAVSRTQHRDVEVGINDNGFYLSSANRFDPVRALKLLKHNELRRVSEIAIDKSEVLKRRFRHCATRALMILRNYKGNKKNVGRQQVSSMILLTSVKRISENFPILKEARREVLEDLMDIENATKVMKDINEGKIKIVEINTKIPSPFAFNLVLQGFSDMLKIEDKVEFVKRMHKMILASISISKDKDKKEFVEEQMLDYEKLWEEEEKEKERKKDTEKDELVTEIWNLKKVPVYIKEELVNIAYGEKEIRDDTVESLRQNKKTIEETWPKIVKDFVLEKVINNK